MNFLGGLVMVAERGPSALGTIEPGAAAHDLARTGCVVGGGPLGHVAVHVIQSPGIWLEAARG